MREISWFPSEFHILSEQKWLLGHLLEHIIIWTSKPCTKNFPEKYSQVEPRTLTRRLNLSRFWPKPRHSFLSAKGNSPLPALLKDSGRVSITQRFKTKAGHFSSRQMQLRQGSLLASSAQKVRAACAEDPGWLQRFPSVHLQQHLLFTASLFPHGWPGLTLLRLQKLKGPEVRKTGNPNSENLSNNVS